MLIVQLEEAVEGTAADKNLSAGMLSDLYSQSEDLSSAAAKGHRKASKFSAIASEEVVRLWDEKERKDSEMQQGQLPGVGRKIRALQKKLAPRTNSKGMGIEVIGLEKELEESHLSKGDSHKTIDDEEGGL